jgi:signal peptidase II
LYRVRVFAIAATVIALDQITKVWAVSRLEVGSDIRVIGDFFRFSFTRNPGASFSFATGATWLFTFIALVVAVAIVKSSRTLTHPIWAASFGGLLGGAVGNLLDRIFRSPGHFQGHVVDFIRFPHFPLFNVADCAIVTSAALMILMSLRGIEMSSETRGEQ